MIMSYGHFGEDSSIQTIIDQHKSQVQSMNDGLYAALKSKTIKGDLPELVDQWHSRALYWMNLSGKIPTADKTTAELWKKVGIQLVSDAQSLATQLKSNAVLTVASNFLIKFPDSADTVIRQFIKKAGEYSQTLGMETVKLVLLLAAGLAIGSILLKKSGAGINAGFLKLGK